MMRMPLLYTIVNHIYICYFQIAYKRLCLNLAFACMQSWAFESKLPHSCRSLFLHWIPVNHVHPPSEMQELKPRLARGAPHLLSNRFGIGLVRRADSEGTLGM